MVFDGIAMKIFIWMEGGCKKKIPKVMPSDKLMKYEITKNKFQELKKEFTGIRKQMGKKKFEEKIGIKLEG